MSGDIKLDSLPCIKHELGPNPHIERLVPGYERDDPRTLPYIGWSNMNYPRSDIADFRRVAFERSVADEVALSVSKHKMTEVRVNSKGRAVWLNRRFYRLPYSYDEWGNAKWGNYLTVEELDHWVHAVTRKCPKDIRKHRTVKTTGPQSAANVLMSVLYGTAEPTNPPRPHSAAEAFEQAMNILEGIPSNGIVNEDIDHKLAAANKRILNLQADIDARQATINRCERTREQHTIDWDRAVAAEAKIVDLEIQLHKKDIKLEAEQRARLVAEERVFTLHAAVKKCNIGDAKKRKATEEGFEGEWKKPRAGEEGQQCAQM